MPLPVIVLIMTSSLRVLSGTLPRSFNESENVLSHRTLQFVGTKLWTGAKRNVTVVSKKIVTLWVTNVAIRLTMNKNPNDVNVKLTQGQIENTNARRPRDRAVLEIRALSLVRALSAQMN